MVIINQLKRAISALMALTISATSMGAISADAYGIKQFPNSAFKYEMSASILSDTQIELTVDVTNNPGFNELCFSLFYEGCNGYKCARIYDTDSGFTINSTHIFNNTKKTCPVAIMVLDDEKRDRDYTGNLTIRYIFNVDNAYEDVCKFSMGIVTYNSHNENIDFSVPIEKLEQKYFEEPVITNDNITYTVGDMDNNGIIEISDASAVGRLVGFTENKKGISIWELNANISHGAWGGSYDPNDFDFASEFPDLLCAEVADANNDKSITSADSEEVLTYYVNNMALIPYESLVGKVNIKKTLVLAPNT